MSASTAAVLMDVLERVESEHFQAQLDAAGGDRPDGCQPPLWRVCFDLAHALPSTADSPWLQELEHSMAHVMAADHVQELRGALVMHAAITAAWVAALDARSGS